MVSPVITIAIHMFVQWAFGFSYILFVATTASDQTDNILCCAVYVLPIDIILDKTVALL